MTDKLIGKLSPVGNLSGAVAPAGRISGILSIGSTTEPLPYDEGDYTVIPGETQIVLETENMSMSGNVVIEAIPDNYGRISFTGSSMRIY